MFDKSIERFPVKEKYIYLTHCGIAPLYAPALRREHEVGAEQSRSGTLVYKQYDSILDGLREAAASLLRTIPDNLAFVKNTSEAIGLIANGYPFQPGDQSSATFTNTPPITTRGNARNIAVSSWSCCPTATSPAGRRRVAPSPGRCATWRSASRSVLVSSP